MRCYLPALFLLLLVACSSSKGIGADLPGRVTYEVSSWGHLETRWQVNPDGSGELWRGSGLGKGAGMISKFRMTLNAKALRALFAAVEPIRERTARGIKCREEITDMPYGTIIWDYPGARQSYDFNDGCRSPEADAVARQLQTAQYIVEQQAMIEPNPYIVERSVVR